jgi:hypothetical protein
MAKFDLNGFYKFCDNLRVETKDRGSIRLGSAMLGTQKLLVQKMVEGIEDGIHEFLTLKARQLGISTVSLAMDLFWAGKYRGINGALVVHDEPARDQFRTTMELYYGSLPNELKWPIRQHNRNQLVFENGSRFQYKIAGTSVRAGSSSLGRSSALSFCHSTECAFYGDENGIESLVATFAQQNPHRLFHWESTANGFNHYWDMWRSAKNAHSKRTIFIGFWANELYRLPRGSALWAAYWGANGRLTREERAMVREVKQLYDVVIDDEQIAWRRWTLKEILNDNEIKLEQEYPATEFEAFISSGSQFFTARRLADAHKILNDDDYDYYRLQVGANFSDTVLLPTSKRNATLTIYEEPVPDGVYALGADPAYGSSDEADRYAISVWRCYSDRMEQVAEFCTTELETFAFAWVMVYLAGSYPPCTWNLEVNGPGQAVLTELQNISRLQTVGPISERGGMSNVMKSVRTYLYRRYDSLYSQPTAIHTQTTHQQKERYMGCFKDYFERGFLVVRSRELLEEMKTIVRTDSGSLSASSKKKDDRVIAAALAVIAWNDQIRSGLMIHQKSYEKAHKPPEQAQEAISSRLVVNMLERAGIRQTPKQKVPGVSSGVAR